MELSWGEECFVCGKDNTEGLQLEFAVNEPERSIAADWVPRSAHQGYAGIVHGGLISTVLDEAVGKLSTCLGMPAVTTELNVRFQKPIAPGERVRVLGRITEVRRRLLVGAAEAVLGDGSVAASATAKLLRAAP